MTSHILLEIVWFSELLPQEITGCYSYSSTVKISPQMAKNTAVLKSGRAASPSRLPQSKPFLLFPVYPPQLSLQRLVAVTPASRSMCQSNLECSQWNCTPQKGGKQWDWRSLPGKGLQDVKSEPPSDSSSRNRAAKQHHRFLSHSDEALTGTKSLLLFIPPHFCSSGPFYGMCLCAFLGFLCSFSCINAHFPAGALCRWHLGHLEVAFEEWLGGMWDILLTEQHSLGGSQHFWR